MVWSLAVMRWRMAGSSGCQLPFYIIYIYLLHMKTKIKLKLEWVDGNADILCHPGP